MKSIAKNANCIKNIKKQKIKFITVYQTEIVAREGMIDLSEREIKLKIIEQAETIAKAICKGKDVELRKSASGVSVCEVSKKVVSR